MPWWLPSDAPMTSAADSVQLEFPKLTPSLLLIEAYCSLGLTGNVKSRGLNMQCMYGVKSSRGVDTGDYSVIYYCEMLFSIIVIWGGALVFENLWFYGEVIASDFVASYCYFLLADKGGLSATSVYSCFGCDVGFVNPRRATFADPRFPCSII